MKSPCVYVLCLHFLRVRDTLLFRQIKALGFSFSTKPSLCYQNSAVTAATNQRDHSHVVALRNAFSLGSLEDSFTKAD